MTDTDQRNRAHRWFADVWGGVAAMLVALPSSIAFGVLVFTAIGPEHAGAGAIAGALGAGVLGVVAPIVGRNGGFITAPCAPAAAVMSGLAASLAHEHGLPIERVIALMVLAALISAGMQVLYGLVRLGRLMKYIPYQVVTGYLSGVSLIIALGQVPKLLGYPRGVGLFAGLTHPSLWQWPGVVVGVVTIAVTALSPLLTRRVPSVILGLAAGIGTYFALGAVRPDLLALDGNGLVIGTIDSSGSLVEALTGGVTSLRSIEIGDAALVVAAAATLSVLLSIDTLKTGVVLDALTHRRHNSNRELLAQGTANAVTALAGGMPGAGTMGPTLVNVASGGRKPLSGIIEGVLVLVAFLALRPVVAWVPIGALAGILLVVAAKMFDWKMLRLATSRETILDLAIIVAVIAVAEGVGLIQASVVGVALAILLFIRDQIHGSVIVRKRDLREVSSKTKRLSSDRELLDHNGDQAVVVELQGNLFFGTTDQLFTELLDDLQTRRFILIDLRRVQSMDYTAGHLFQQIHERLQERGGRLLLSGMPSRSRRDIEHYLHKLGIIGAGGGVEVYDMRDEALVWMEERILESVGWTRPGGEAPLELGEIELFREFDEAALAQLAAIVRPIHLDAGERLFVQGDTGDELYLLRRGAIDIVLPLADGVRHHLATMARGDYFGEMAFLDRGVRSADAIAKVDVELFALSRRRFDEVARANPVVATKVFARLALLVSKRIRTADHELSVLQQR